MQMSGYFDNSATTKPSKNVIACFTKTADSLYGNPASLHSMGIKSFKLLESARRTVAEKISAAESEIIFTSGGTESNNIAILGAALKNKNKKGRIVITEIEHPSVMETAVFLETMGFEVKKLKVDQNGGFLAGELKEYLTEDTILVSVMLVNNETGICPDISEIKKHIKPNTLLHIDAVQAFGKIDINVKRLGADMLSLSAHKIHGIKGVGALYLKNNVKIKGISFGGMQEKLRSGTQPIELIAAFKTAALEIDIAARKRHMNACCDTFSEEIKDIGQINFINKDIGIINASFFGIKSEVMLRYLSEKGFYVSSGSACAKGKKSYALKALALNGKAIDSAIRISFSVWNSEKDVKELAEAIKSGAKELIKRL